MDPESRVVRGASSPRFGSLMLGEPAGAGVAGEVWHARDATAGARHSLEILPAGVSERTVRALVDQHHGLRVQGVVAATGVEVAGGRVGVLWSPVEGPTLADLLAESGAMGFDEALELYAEMLEVVRGIHQRGIPHLALSPRCFVLVVQGDGVHPHLLGLGLAGALGGAVPAGVDERYRAPEQVAGSSGDLRADTYALAAIFYEMLTGSPPFPSGRPNSSAGPKPLYLAAPSCPVQVSEVVRAALSADPGLRPATIDAYIDGLLDPSSVSKGDVARVPASPKAEASLPGGRRAAPGTAAASPGHKGTRGPTRLGLVVGWTTWALTRLLTFLVLPAMVMAIAVFTTALFAGRETWAATESVAMAEARAAADAEVARWAAGEVVAMGGNAERIGAALADLDHADTLRRRSTALVALRTVLELELHGLPPARKGDQEARRRTVSTRLDDVAAEAASWEEAVAQLEEARGLPLAQVGTSWGLAEEDWVRGLAGAWGRYERTGRPAP